MTQSSFAIALLCLGCGGSDDTPPSDATAPTDLTTYQALIRQVADAAQAYQVAMAQPSTTAETCAAVHAAYDHQVRPVIAHMLERCGALDTVVGEHGGEGHDDLTCTTSSIAHELDRHATEACHHATLQLDREACAQHVAAVITYAQHERQRCDEIDAGMHGAGWHWHDATAEMRGECAHE